MAAELHLWISLSPRGRMESMAQDVRYGLRMQAEWLPLVINPEVSSLVCGGGCVVHLNATLVSQGEIAVGPIFRF